MHRLLNPRICIVSAVLLVALVASHLLTPSRAAEEPAGAAPRQVSFNEHIRPIFAKHCVACHGGVKQASGISLIYRDKALAEGDSGMRAIVPGDVEESYLVERIADPDPDYRMPPAEHGSALSDREISLVKQWVAEGAKWEEHWSFVPPRPQELPTTRAKWGNNRIDSFVLARLEAEGLAPSPAAEKSEWLRRVTFDLVGVPPTAQQHDAFLADDSPEAYERVVERLLASPKFGERWAAMWLDLARYSDTMGFEKDPHRDIWPYRDWLIRALNDDMPYNQFLIKQLAGDLLPEATMDDRVAAAFHRNTQTNTEGGTDDEEFRTAAVLDRVNTTWQVFGGLTFGCTQCHSHPYDPIENQEYYQFVAVFNTTRDWDRDEETPRLRVPKNQEDWEQANELDRRISQLKQQLHAAGLPLAEDSNQWKSLSIEHALSTGETKLKVRDDPNRAGNEYVTQGTVTAGSVFTIDLVPGDVQRLTAIRIDSLPMDLEEALRNPEAGFAVTRLRAWVVTPGKTPPREVSFYLAMCDEADPILDPAASLKDNNDGWGVYPKLDRPRWAVFVPSQPVELPEDARIRLQLKQNRSATGMIAQVMNRGRFAVSASQAWTNLLADPEFRQLEDKLAAAERERAAIASVSMPAIEEQAQQSHRHTYLFERGNWLSKGDEVQPGVPAVFPAIETDEAVDRLDVARWFASTEHPLTARVLVNRFWEQLFGTGIVETVGDFGTSGILPSHPQLLDDLAARFQHEMSWSTKQLLREIVLSATYRQSSQAGAELAKLDPRNRLLARGPRLRLTAEMVRDQALMLSGKASDKMFGPSVMPPQPDGIWRSVYSGAQWVTAKGEDRYRRAIYTYWKRTSPYPSMMTFDAPSREVCSVRRIATNTPLQPLVTMNDPVFVECAQGFAERMAAEGGSTPREQIAWALEQATGDAPRAAAVTAMTALYDDALQSFDAANEEMAALGSTPESYALTIVASAVMNLDDVITR